MIRSLPAGVWGGDAAAQSSHVLMVVYEPEGKSLEKMLHISFEPDSIYAVTFDKNENGVMTFRFAHA